MNSFDFETLKRLAHGIASQFGSNCEIVIHDLTSNNAEHSIAAIENGHVTGRSIGDPPSQVVLEQLHNSNMQPDDHLGYLTRTPDGKILKSSTIYIPGPEGKVEAIFSINYDISSLLIVDNALKDIVTPVDTEQKEPEKITHNVNELLDYLINKSVELVGKPVALMNKDDKIKAIQFLNKNGALLITKSGDKISKFFGISKYSLYSYIDVKQEVPSDD